MVLDNGEVAEYDSPLALVKNPDSFLGKLIRKVGKSFLDKMLNMAEEGQMGKKKSYKEEWEMYKNDSS